MCVLILSIFFLLDFSKRLVEKIRITISTERPLLIYTYKLYAFQTENETIDPLKLQEICEEAIDTQNEFGKSNDNNDEELMFNHEWTHQKVHCPQSSGS